MFEGEAAGEGIFRDEVYYGGNSLTAEILEDRPKRAYISFLDHKVL